MWVEPPLTIADRSSRKTTIVSFSCTLLENGDWGFPHFEMYIEAHMLYYAPSMERSGAQIRLVGYHTCPSGCEKPEGPSEGVAGWTPHGLQENNELPSDVESKGSCPRLVPWRATLELPLDFVVTCQDEGGRSPCHCSLGYFRFKYYLP